MRTDRGHSGGEARGRAPRPTTSECGPVPARPHETAPREVAPRRLSRLSHAATHGAYRHAITPLNYSTQMAIARTDAPHHMRIAPRALR
eukprot:CAMPEP_0115853466 /NCGR_PEP_ID=MMETSP0287-20121206/13518_1 /TAXON_ID=412157 /ORGANISM="Chrysochromulina rotalis, Strain UIO044" /LENGTH=88 /DNA_ID=CAMNT_0003307543 /DNA_START=173 /DNA_END=435 /DNA_ORIENTATION=+